MLFHRTINKEQQNMINAVDTAIANAEPAKKTSRLSAFGKSALSCFKSFQTKMSETIKEKSSNFSRNFSAAYKAWQISSREIALENYEKTMFKKIDKILEYDPDYFQKTHYGNSSMQYLLKKYSDTHQAITVEPTEVKAAAESVSVKENTVSLDKSSAQTKSVAVQHTAADNISEKPSSGAQATAEAPASETADNKQRTASSRAVHVAEVNTSDNEQRGAAEQTPAASAAPAAKSDDRVLETVLEVENQPDAPSTIQEKTEQLETASKYGSNTYINGLHSILNTVADEINKWQTASTPEEKAALARNIEAYMNKGMDGMAAVCNRVKNNAAFTSQEMITSERLSDDAKRSILSEASAKATAVDDELSCP